MIDMPRSNDQTTPSRPESLLTLLSRRLAERASVLLAALVIIAAFVALGSLDLAPALWGAGALLVWCGLWFSSGDAAGSVDAELRRRLDTTDRVVGGAFWTAIIANLPDPALVLDTNGIVLVANRAAAEVFTSAQSGRHISQVTRAPELLTCIDVAKGTQQTQSCRLDFSVPVARSLVGTVAPLESPPGIRQEPALLIVLRDLTEQDRLIRMRADFVANASHELRTPLASLKGFVETLRGAAKDDTQAREKFLIIMQQQADRMARLIDDLLSLSRVEMQAHVMPRDRVELGGVIGHVAQSLAPIADERSVAINIGPMPESFVVTGDRDELIQVFQNLLENAIKYGRPGGQVSVQSSVAVNASGSGRITVAIADNGPGIAPEHLPRLTERFYRVNAAQSRNAGGTGLGLAIVKHVLNRHRGDLQIDSVVGQGSTFRVSFPVRRDG
jgi:two-component system, OmpR family, phosphate regulon sensor histidine kinase PhoR